MLNHGFPDPLAAGMRRHHDAFEQPHASAVMRQQGQHQQGKASNYLAMLKYEPDSAARNFLYSAKCGGSGAQVDGLRIVEMRHQLSKSRKILLTRLTKFQVHCAQRISSGKK